MNKQEVMKALDMCINHPETCAGCPYEHMDDCDMMRNKDTLALLKSNNSKPTYHTAYIYTKHTNLMPWLQSNYIKFGTHGTTEQAQRIREMYSKDRDVQLILLVRHEDGKRYCRIKCPINPLPIKGEFETTTAADVGRLIMSMGWSFSHKIELNSPLYK